MYNNTIVILLARILPIFAVVFVISLFIYKIYIKIRSKFHTKVNCWFCNEDARVPFLERNSWNCPQCEQYNGFNKDGDYNRDLTQQRDCSGLSQNTGNGSMFGQSPSTASSNGFCDACNEAQRLKIEKLALFEPKVESRFDQELKVYTEQLEEQYRLCTTCDSHLRNVLREKKKMVLGSKFLDIIIRGAELLKQPHFTRIQKVQQQIKMRRIIGLTSFITAMNIICLLYGLPLWTHGQFVGLLGESLGKNAFIVYSHIVTVAHLLNDYICNLLQYEWIEKFQMVFRTLVMMLMYTLGITLPRIASLGLSELFTIIYPYAMLGLNFTLNVVDGLKFSRFTLLLLYWSLYATGLCVTNLNSIMLISSIVTLALCLTNRPESISIEHESSFHKLCPDDYLSDETISMLSEELNCSRNSPQSLYHQGSQHGTSSIYKRTSPQQLVNNGNRSSLYTPTVSDMSTATLMPSNQNYLNEQKSGVPFTYAKSSYSRSPLTSPRSSLFYSHTDLYNGTPGHQLPAATHMNTQDQLNNSFHSTFAAPSYQTSMSPNPFAVQQFSQQVTAVPPPLHSAFSVSSNAVFQQQQQQQLPQSLLSTNSMSNLKLPTHFSTNNLHHLSNDANAWLVANGVGVGYATNTNPNLMMGNTNNGFIQNGNLSRTSSFSSGFESQFGGARNTETPFAFDTLHEAIDGTYPNENNIANYPVKGKQPLTSNGNPNAFGSGYGQMGFGRDTFNLSKMNKHLPNIRRGDLLRKWSESRVKDTAGSK